MRTPEINDVIIMLEFQNQWTQPGLFNTLIKRELRRQDVVQNAIRLTGAARMRGVPILHAPLWVNPKKLKGLYAHLTRGLFFRKGSKKGEIDARVLDDSDIIINGRTAFDAFTGSELDKVLSRYPNHKMLFCGFATDQCVLQTVTTAQECGYDAQLITDCSATFTKGIQNRTEKRLKGRVVTSDLLVKEYTT